MKSLRAEVVVTAWWRTFSGDETSTSIPHKGLIAMPSGFADADGAIVSSFGAARRSFVIKANRRLL